MIELFHDIASAAAGSDNSGFFPAIGAFFGVGSWVEWMSGGIAPDHPLYGRDQTDMDKMLFGNKGASEGQ